MIKYQGGKSPYKFFYFITVRDNEGHARKFVYNIFRSIVKKHDAKYYGVLAEKPFPHVHAIIITERVIDYKDVWKLIPDGVHFDAQFLNNKDSDDLKRILRYIETHDGFLFTLKALIGTTSLKSSNVTFHGSTVCRMVKVWRRWTA